MKVRNCDLCANPPEYKCPDCKGEMVEPVKPATVAPWWPAIAAQPRRSINGDNVPANFLYV